MSRAPSRCLSEEAINHKGDMTVCRRGVLLTTLCEEAYVGQAYPNHHCCHNTVHTPDGNSDLF